MTVKAGSVSSAGLQFNMEASVHLLAKEYGVELRTKEVVSLVHDLHEAEVHHKDLEEKFLRAQNALNASERKVDNLRTQLALEKHRQLVIKPPTGQDMPTPVRDPNDPEDNDPLDHDHGTYGKGDE
jgi:hypothetical protein